MQHLHLEGDGNESIDVHLKDNKNLPLHISVWKLLELIIDWRDRTFPKELIRPDPRVHSGDECEVRVQLGTSECWIPAYCRSFKVEAAGVILSGKYEVLLRPIGGYFWVDGENIRAVKKEPKHLGYGQPCYFRWASQVAAGCNWLPGVVIDYKKKFPEYGGGVSRYFIAPSTIGGLGMPADRIWVPSENVKVR